MKQIANVIVGVDTFGGLYDRVNLIATAMRTEVMTANSTVGNTAGNAYLNGKFGANVVYAANVSGGVLITNSSSLPEIVSANLNITSNVAFLGNNTTVSSNTLNVSSNTTFSNTVSLTRDTTLSGNISTISGNTLNVSSNTTFSNTVLFSRTVTFSNTLTINSPTVNFSATSNIVLASNTKILLGGSPGANGAYLTSTANGTTWYTPPAVLDSVTNTSIVIPAAANSVKNAYDRAIAANTLANTAYTQANTALAAALAANTLAATASSKADAAYANAITTLGNANVIIANLGYTPLDSAGGAISNNLAIGGILKPGNDNNFTVGMTSSKPTIVWDTGGDLLEYDRTNNVLQQKIANVVRGGFNAADGVFSSGDFYLARTDQAYGYITRPNTTNFKNLAFAVQGGGALDVIQLNSVSTYTTGTFSPGNLGNFFLTKNDSITPQINFDTNDTFGFNRTGNYYSFGIGAQEYVTFSQSSASFKNMDLVTYRTGGTTGVLFLNSAGNRYLFNDGSAYQLPGQNLYINGQIAWHSGNDGSGSGLDADTLDGQQGAYYLPSGSYTPSDVLSKILTVDGAGSGLDADTLDGVQATGFLRYNVLASANVYHAASTASNDTFGGLEIREAGQVGAAQSIPTYAPGLNFHWAGRVASRIYMNSGGQIVLGAQGDITNNRRDLVAANIYSNGNLVWHSGNDGSGSGLDADTLDGQQGAYYLPSASYTAGDILNKLKTVDGPGSGLDAEYLNSQPASSYITTGTYTAADILNKLKTVDGSGSGLDADLIRGLRPEDAMLGYKTYIASSANYSSPTQFNKAGPFYGFTPGKGSIHLYTPSNGQNSYLFEMVLYSSTSFRVDTLIEYLDDAAYFYLNGVIVHSHAAAGAWNYSVPYDLVVGTNTIQIVFNNSGGQSRGLAFHADFFRTTNTTFIG